MNKIFGVFGVLFFTCLMYPISSMNTVSRSVASPIKVSQEKPQNKSVVEGNDYRFELQSCQRKKEIVICNILTTNLSSNERNISLFGNHNYGDVPRPQIIDPSGNEYVIQDVYVGQNHAGRYEVVSTMPANIPKRLLVTLKLPQKVNKLAIFEVVYRDGSGLDVINAPIYSKAQFHNVDIVPAKSR